jgi:flagellar motor switch/type III secretory pathway protein FliN
MRRDSFKRVNEWREHFRSAAFRKTADEAGRGLELMAGERVSLAFGVEGEIQVDEVLAAAGGPLAVRLEDAGGFWVAVVPSPEICGWMVRRITGSARLSMYRHFQRAAAEVIAFYSASPMGQGGAFTLAVAHPDGIAGRRERCVNITADFHTSGASGLIRMFIPYVRPPAAERTLSGSFNASVIMEMKPLSLEILRSAAPGDVFVVEDGTAPASFALSVTGGRFGLEYPLKSDEGIGARRFSINGKPEEVDMSDSDVAVGNGGRPGEAGHALENVRLPARLELCTVLVNLSDMGSLGPGSVIDIGEDTCAKARMYVCGTLFAEGRIEKFEDFHGFTVEKVF